MPTPISPWLRDSPGALFQLIRRVPLGMTRTEIGRQTHLSRTAVIQRLDALRSAGLVTEGGQLGAPSGRPAERYCVDRRRGVILVADLGAMGLTAAIADAAGTPKAVVQEMVDITDGPAAVLARVQARFDELLRGLHVDATRVLGIGVAVPGPVDHETGRTIDPPIMSGWHDHDIPGFFTDLFDCPVDVEKDTNAMVLGEHRAGRRDVDDMVLVKIGTGIGTGLLLRGELYRGADGAAGDIGHTPLTEDPDGPVCRCGNVGCVEAYAGGWALARDLAAATGRPCTVGDVVRAVRSGDATAIALVRRAGEIIGGAVADIVNMVNPRRVVFAGQLAALDELILATAREAIYRRSLPLATRNLQIVASSVPDAGVRGLAELVTDQTSSAAAIDALLA
jgi:predicted NBD/HSP70 family sugar kinase